MYQCVLNSGTMLASRGLTRGNCAASTMEARSSSEMALSPRPSSPWAIVDDGHRRSPFRWSDGASSCSRTFERRKAGWDARGPGLSRFRAWICRDPSPRWPPLRLMSRGSADQGMKGKRRRGAALWRGTAFRWKLFQVVGRGFLRASKRPSPGRPMVPWVGGRWAVGREGSTADAELSSAGDGCSTGSTEPLVSFVHERSGLHFLMRVDAQRSSSLLIMMVVKFR